MCSKYRTVLYLVIAALAWTRCSPGFGVGVKAIHDPTYTGIKTKTYQRDPQVAQAFENQWQQNQRQVYTHPNNFQEVPRPETNQKTYNTYQRNEADLGRPIYERPPTQTIKSEFYSACPPGHTGLLPYASDCKKFLNCYNGEGHAQNCGPGTAFNPETLQCDHPNKVNCGSQNTVSQQREDKSRSSRLLAQNQAEVVCPTGVSGLQPHPTDCRKFLNCGNGNTYVQDCGPGTAYDAQRMVCDFEHKVDCSRRYSVSEINQVDQTAGTHTWSSSTPVTGNTIATTTQESSYNIFCPEGVNGFFHHPFDQTRFINCKNGRTAIQKCAPNEVFSLSQHYCVSRQQLNNQYDYVSYNMGKEPHFDDVQSLVRCPPGTGGVHAYPFGPSKQLVCDQNGNMRIRDCSVELCEVARLVSSSSVNAYSAASVQCPVGHQQQYFPYPFTGAKYISCENAQLSIAECSNEKVFSLTNKNCQPLQTLTSTDYVQLVQGPTRYGKEYNEWDSMIKTGMLMCPKYAMGNYLHPFDCTKFLRCSRGQIMVESCEPGTVFCISRKQCIPRDQVEAFDRVEYWSDTQHEFNAQPVQWTSTQSTDNVLSNKILCPQTSTGNTGFAYYPHPFDGRQYFICQSGRTVVKSCPQAYSFNLEQKSCAPNPVTADSMTINTSFYTYPADVFCPMNANGDFVYPFDCTKYIRCTNGKTLIANCAPGTVFSLKFSQCKPATTVAADDRVAQNPQEPDATQDTELTCPSHGNVLHPHPHDCTKYVSCANGKASIQTCGPGTAWDATNQYCNFAEKLNCAQAKVETKPCPAGLYGTFAHPSDCKKFLDCKNGIGRVLNCPVGTAWDESSGVCAFSENTICSNAAQPPTVPTPTSPTYDHQRPQPGWSAGNEYVPPVQDNVLFVEGSNMPNHQFTQIKHTVSVVPSYTSTTTSDSTNVYYAQPVGSQEDSSETFNSNPYAARPDNLNRMPYPVPGSFVNQWNSTRESRRYPITPWAAANPNQLPPPQAVKNPYKPDIGQQAIYTTTTTTNYNNAPFVPTPHSEASTLPYVEPYQPQGTYLQPPLAHIAPIGHYPAISTAEVLRAPGEMHYSDSYAGVAHSRNSTWPNGQIFPQTEEADEGQRPEELKFNEALRLLLKPYVQQNSTINPANSHIMTVFTQITKSSVPQPNESDAELIVAGEQPHLKTGGYKPVHNGEFFEHERSSGSPDTSEIFQQHHHHHHHKHNHKHDHHLQHQHSAEFHRQHPNWPNPFATETTTEQLVENIPETSKESVPEPTDIVPTASYNFSLIDVRSSFDDCAFDCGDNVCLNKNQVCNGVNDCANRKDELNCDHLGYEVRLTGGTSSNMGRIEIKILDKWGYVCDDKFGLRDADVVCRELGFTLGAKEVRGNSFYGTADMNPTYMMDDVNCLGNETSLRQCEFLGWGVHNCESDEIAGVVCKVPTMKCPSNYWLCATSQECIPSQFVCDNTPDCADESDESEQICKAPVEFRLEGGRSANEGRLEVRYRGAWGTVCDDDFGYAEAQVACNSFGYFGQARIDRNIYGPGNGPIWLDQVACFGNETTLEQCTHAAWGDHNCNHTEDVGLHCTAGPAPAFLTRSQGNNANSLSGGSNDQLINELRNCGLFNPNLADEFAHPEQRVVNGTRAKRGQHPWQATIRARGVGGISSHWCGAVLISKQHLITAAHCLVGSARDSFLVRLGDHYAAFSEGTEKDVFIERWYIHENFREGAHMNNDIALIVLKRPVVLNDYIQAICLPDKNAQLEPDRVCTISGWGSIKSGVSTPSTELRAAKVPILPDELCSQEHVYGRSMTSGMFCAGTMDESVDACDGDSGGPLACTEDGRETLYGIISWGQHCGFANKPGVYVRVEKYIDWIYNKINEDLQLPKMRT